MKKLKIIFIGIAVLGIVGSVLAFTAKPNNTAYCARQHFAPASAFCTNQLLGIAVDSGGTLYYGLKKGTAACTSTICNTDIRLSPLE